MKNTITFNEYTITYEPSIKTFTVNNKNTLKVLNLSVFYYFAFRLDNYSNTFKVTVNDTTIDLFRWRKEDDPTKAVEFFLHHLKTILKNQHTIYEI